jgi:hypothetical protein
MEEWYVQQEFYSEIKLNRIKTWMAQETIDIFMYIGEGPTVTLAG